MAPLLGPFESLGVYRISETINVAVVAVIVMTDVAIMILIFLLKIAVFFISCSMCFVLSITVFSITGFFVAAGLLGKTTSLSLEVLSA